MGNNKGFQKDQKQQPAQPQVQPGSRNNEEVGEPIQLTDDKSQKPGQQNKPGMGQPREGEKPGQHQGGGQHQETNR